MSKISLKSQSKSTLTGLLGILLSSLLIRHFDNTPYFEVMVMIGVVLANVAGYYEGATRAEEEYGIDETEV